MSRTLDRAGGWPRRVLACVLLLLAVATGVGGRMAARPSGHPVVVAARDLPAGAVLAVGDLTRQPWGGGAAPPGAFDRADQVAGRRLSGALGRGEAVTTSRLLGRGLATGLPAGQVAVAVNLGSASVGLLRPGDRIDLVAAPVADGAGATVLARDALVLAVLPGKADSEGTGGVVVAVDRSAVAVMADAQSRSVLAAVAGDP